MPRGILMLVGFVLTSSAALPLRADGPSVGTLLSKVGEAVERYYARAQSVICLESVTQQNLARNTLSDTPFLRRLVYDLRVAWDAMQDGGERAEAAVQRELLEVNNRKPRPNDKPKCFDPSAISPDTLSMLLPVNQDDYVFTAAGVGRLDGRSVPMIDARRRTIGPVVVKRKDDVEDCFSIDLGGRTRFRIWLDPDTGNVLRLDESLNGYAEATLPRKDGQSEVVVFERVTSTIVYKPVTFDDPAETLMLPSSEDYQQVDRRQGFRSTHRYSNYRRYTTDGRIVEDTSPSDPLSQR